MKTFMQFLVRGLMAMMMVLGMGEVLATRHVDSELTKSWGNPLPEWCEEPCGVTTRRGIVVRITNDLNQPIQVNYYNFLSVKHTSIFSRRVNPVLVNHYFRDLPHAFSLFLQQGPLGPVPGSSFCYSPFPIPASYSLPVPLHSCNNFPLIIPPQTTRYFLAELKILFCSDTSQIPGGNYQVDGEWEYSIIGCDEDQESLNCTIKKQVSSTLELVCPSTYDAPNIPNYPGLEQDYYAFVSTLEDSISLEDPRVGGRVGVEDINKNENNVRIFPTQIKHSANVSIFSKTGEVGTIKVFDLKGKCVKVVNRVLVKNGFPSNIELDLSLLTKGVYFLQYKSENKGTSIKFIKQ